MSARLLSCAALLLGCTPSPSPNVTAQTETGSPPQPTVSQPPPATSTTPPAASSAPAKHANPTIDGVVKSLAATNGMFINGGFPKITLPASASTREVLDLMFTRMSFDEGPVRRFTIVEERDVTIPPDTRAYHAARLDTDRGGVVVLMRYEAQVGWWTRAYRDV